VILVWPGGLDSIVFSAALPSGASWSLKAADLIIGLGLIVLFFEVIKAARSSVASMIDQILSIVLFALSIVAFVMVRSAGTATFLLLTEMSFVDVIAGFVVTVSVSRRDITIER